MFLRNQTGSIAISAAVGGVVMVAAIGVAFDTSRLVSARHSLQAVADAAALSAAIPEGISNGERRKRASATVTEYIGQTGQDLKVSETVTTIRNSGKDVDVRLASEVELIFGGVIGRSTHTVSTTATAREFIETDAASLSVSFVIDLSESMDDALDGMSRLDAVKAASLRLLNALNSAGDVASGVYPFNWGAVEDSTVTLTNGVFETTQAISYLQTGEGAVSSPSIEQAVEDQIASGGGDRVIFYLTDSEIDSERGDSEGEYLSDDARYDTTDKKCKNAEETLIKDAEKLARDYGSGQGNGPGNSGEGDDEDEDDGDEDEDGPLDDVMEGFGDPRVTNVGNPLIDMDIGELEEAMRDDKHAGHDHAGELEKDMARLVEQREKFIENCRPVQTVRVADACEKARENNISIMAVNLSGDDLEGTNIVDMCLNGIEEPENDKGNKRTADDPDVTEPLSPGSRMTVTVSEDGTSRSVTVGSTQELSEFLQSVLPDGPKTERYVRLVR